MSEYLWMKYAAIDIDMFHLQIRSIFDYISKILRRIANYPEQVPDKSFHRLREWLKKDKDKNEQKLGKDLTSYVLSCDWFEEICNIRDEVIHRGGFTIAFPMQYTIMFNIYPKQDELISLPKKTMHNDSVVNFEKYAALIFAYLIIYIEEICTKTYYIKNIKRMVMNGKSHFTGSETLVEWMKKIL